MVRSDNTRLKVLHLVRWYPNRYDPMPGLFIQRHAEAANLFANCGLVYTHQVDVPKLNEGKYFLDYDVINSVPTSRVYYKAYSSPFQPLNKLINSYRFFKANNLGIKKITNEIGSFDLVHVHILTRLGIYGLYYKIIKKKPFIITEHWSRYLELTNAFNGLIRKYVTRIIVMNASFVTAVTKNLSNSMQSHNLQNNRYVILPNVVSGTFMDKQKSETCQNKKSTFIHVSCFEDKSKNVSGLLRVISKLSKVRDDFTFRLVGDGMDMEWLKKYSEELELNTKHVTFTGLLEGEALVEEMSKSDMLVIFSNYENFPVVINESLSLGVPVIATRVGGIPERINEQNGVLINPGDEGALQKAIGNFLDKKLTFNMNEIQRKARDEFSPQSIGKTLFELYQKSLATMK